MPGPYWIDPDDTSYSFPPTELALDDPNGLLAVGGDLSSQRLITAYRHGIFPWFNDDQPILWWSPDPRAVITPAEVHISRSLRKKIRQKTYRITFDRAFAKVMTGCAGARNYTDETWITSDMKQAYLDLHHQGIAHSAEAWLGDELVGGLYGLAIGRCFFGESMFSRASDASKCAFVTLARHLEHWGYAIIDCQVGSTHMSSLGAINIPRADFLDILDHNLDLVGNPSPRWQLDPRLAD